MRDRSFIFIFVIIFFAACTPAPASTPVARPASPTPAPAPTATPTSSPASPAPTATPAPTPPPTLPLADGQAVAYCMTGSQLILACATDAAQPLTFPAEITEVTARGESLKVTLADGTEKTLTQDKETGEWEINVMRKLTEVDVSTEEGMQMAQKAVADALAGGQFMEPDEILAKVDLGELKIVQDEKTGAIIVFPKQALDYMKEQGQGIEDSDFARILAVGWQKVDEKMYRNVSHSPSSLQSLAETTYKKGGFAPLPPEWMTLVARQNEDGSPEIVVVMMPAWNFQTLYRFNPEVWREFYPAGRRAFGDPVINADETTALGFVLGLDEDGAELKQRELTLPFLSGNLWMKLVVDKDGQVKIEDEYHMRFMKLLDAQTEVSTGQQWQELEVYEPAGSPSEMLAHALEWKLTEKRIVGVNNKQGELASTKIETNVLGLDPEIVAEAVRLLKEGNPVDEINKKLMELYKEKSTEEINANEAKAAGFEIMTDSEGNPSYIVMVGGKYGVDVVINPATSERTINKEQLDNLRKALIGIESVDPGRTSFFTQQFGTKFISRGTSFTIPSDYKDAFSSNDGVDTIILNPYKSYSIADFIFVIVVESGEVNGGRHGTEPLYGNLSDYKNFGHFAMSWALDWFNQHGKELVDKGVINQKELSEIIGGVEWNLKQYTKGG